MMTLYTCGQRESAAALGHPCGRAARALRAAGHEFSIEEVGGYRMLPWTRRGDVRAAVRELSGQDHVPILVRDDGTVVSGSGAIVSWAKGAAAA